MSGRNYHRNAARSKSSLVKVRELAVRVGWFVWAHPGDEFLMLISPDGRRAVRASTRGEALLILEALGAV